MFNRIKQSLWGALFGILIATQALGQTATLLPNAVQQYFNAQGVPIASGTIDYFVPGQNTRKTTWSSSVESVLNQNPNPVLLSAGGYPQNGGGQVSGTYGDGLYRQVVKDQNNLVIWDSVTGSTGSGSGGGINQVALGDNAYVGMIQSFAGIVAPTNYMFAAGQAVSRTTYATLMSVITYSQSITCSSGSPTISIADTTQIPITAPLEASCFAPGSMVISKTSSSVTMSTNATASIVVNGVFFPWGNGDGATTFNLPDFSGLTLVGRDNLSGTNAGNLTIAYYGANPDAIGVVGGSQSKILTLNNLPPITPTGTITNGAISIVNGTSILQNIGGTGISAGASPITGNAVNITATQSGSTFTGNQFGASTPFSSVQPSRTINYIIKVQADTIVAGLVGVTASLPLVVTTANAISNISLNIAALPADTSPDAINDYLVMRRASDGAYVKINPTTIAGTNTAGVSSLGGSSGALSVGAGLNMSGTTLSTQYIAPGTGGLTMTQPAKNMQMVSLKDYATGNNVTDDTVAIQAAFTYAQSIGVDIFVPCGFYKVTASIDTLGVGFHGLGNCTVFHLIGTPNFPIFLVKLDNYQVYYATYENFVCLNDSSAGTQTSIACIKVFNTTTYHQFAFNHFSNITCLGTYRCIYISNAVGSGQEIGVDQSSFTGIRAANEGANNVVNGIDFQSGSGTGNLFGNNNMITTGCAFCFEGTNTAFAVGDMTFVDNQVNGTGIGLFLSGTAAYRNNIMICGNNWGDLATAISAVSYGTVRLCGNGGNAFAFSGGTLNSGGEFSAALHERRYANIKTSSGTSDNFFAITFPSAGFGGVLIEFTISALVPTVGGQTRTARYVTAENGSCGSLAVTQIDTSFVGTGAPMVLGAPSIGGCVVTFGMGTLINGSSMSYAARVVGGGQYGFDAAMQ